VSAAAPEARAPLSACVISKDEADRIDACLASLAFCDELVVVDSHSSDDTRARAAAHGARVIERDWPGFGPQKRFAVAAATHDWVLCVDADERVSDALRAEIEALARCGFAGASAWSAPRCSRYLGRWIRHGVWYPDRQLRLFDRRRGGWDDAQVHEKVTVDGPVGELTGELLHEPYRALGEHLATIDRYTTLMAEKAAERGKRARWWNLVLNPGVRFLRSYVLKLGFLDGWRGLLIACLAAHYVRMKYAKLLERQQGVTAEAR
jgi:glycosyltransferase involved in cell wall biosynthesis